MRLCVSEPSKAFSTSPKTSPRRMPHARHSLSSPNSAMTPPAHSTTISLSPTAQPSGTTTDGTAAPDPDNTLVRGHYYDLVAKVTSPGEFDIRLSVSPWTLQQIVYTLHGPYFLHLDKTVIPVTVGEKTKIWYESNAESVEIDEGYSPKYKLQDGTEVPLYVLDNTTYSDTLIVSVNPLVDAQSLSDTDRAKYNYFHLKAGNLRKKIDVEPLRLDPYLDVDPVLITIDARERIASGVYSGDISVNIYTNLKAVTITKGEESAWDLVTDSEKSLWLTDWNDSEIEKSNTISIDKEKKSCIETELCRNQQRLGVMERETSVDI